MPPTYSTLFEKHLFADVSRRMMSRGTSHAGIARAGRVPAIHHYSP